MKPLIVTISCIACALSMPVLAQSQKHPASTALSADTAFSISVTDSQPVSPYFFGQNYWSWVEQWGAQVSDTTDQIAALNLNMLRMGGAQPDVNTPEPFDGQKIDKAMRYAKAVGATPIYQLPTLKDWYGNDASVKSAQEIVHYVNHEKHYGVKYFSIGNEPDLYTSQNHKDSTYTPEDTCKLFAQISDAVKATEPSAKILGPDLSMFSSSNPWLVPFLKGCKDKFDIFAIHRYPFSPEQTTTTNVLNDYVTYRQGLKNIRGVLKQYGLEDIPLALTEANVTWSGDPANEVLGGSPGTLVSGLWVADILGVSLEEQLWNLSFWSISEGWSLGFIDGETGQPKPAYYVLKLFSNHFGDRVLHVQNSIHNLSVYAGENSNTQDISIAVINKNSADKTYHWTVEDSKGAVHSFEKTFPALSLTFMVYPESGAAKIWQYTEDMVVKGNPPKQIQ